MDILDRNGDVIYSDDLKQIKESFEAAIKKGEYMSGSKLHGVDFKGIAIPNAELRQIDIRGGNLGVSIFV